MRVLNTILAYVNGNNAAEWVNNFKYANSYPGYELNCEELICTRHISIVMIGNQLKLLLVWVLCVGLSTFYV